MRIPSPFALAVEAIQNALTDITRMGATMRTPRTTDRGARRAFRPDQIVLGNLDSLGLQLALTAALERVHLFEPGYTALVDAVAPGGGVVVRRSAQRPF